jgi:hypothetical protein
VQTIGLDVVLLSGYGYTLYPKSPTYQKASPAGKLIRAACETASNFTALANRCRHYQSVIVNAFDAFYYCNYRSHQARSAEQKQKDDERNRTFTDGNKAARREVENLRRERPNDIGYSTIADET